MKDRYAPHAAAQALRVDPNGKTLRML